MLTKEEIKTIGEEIRKDRTITNNCWFINDKIRRRINERLGSNESKLIRVRVGKDRHPKDGAKHFIVRIKGKHVIGFHPDSWVWIDAAFDQFCDENKSKWKFSYGKREEINNVRVIRVMEDERVNQYWEPT